MSRVTAIISALVILINVRLPRAVNHYRDNAIILQSPARQKCQRTEAGERGQLLTCRCVSVMLLRSMQKYTKELADAVLENDALRDDVAGRRRLHIKAVCQSVREATTASGVDNAASPRLADTAERIISPSERG